MSAIKTMTVAEFHQALKDQGFTSREDLAFVCPICGTIQSAADLIQAGVGETLDEVEKYIGFSCIGRFTNAGPYKKGTPPGKGCDWTLGGLFRLHKLEVVTEDGEHHPHFMPATSEQAQTHAYFQPAAAKCRVCGCTDMDCRGCIERTGQPCHWVEPDLCSACAGSSSAIALNPLSTTRRTI